MTLSKQVIIDRTIKAISQLPTDKAEEISDFALRKSSKWRRESSR